MFIKYILSFLSLASATQWKCNKLSTCQAMEKSQETVSKLLSNINKQSPEQIQPIEVHFTLNSHLDAFWLQSYQQYLEGSGSDPTHAYACTNCIFDEILKALKSIPESTYMLAEMCFFKPWYQQLEEQQKNDVKELIKELYPQGRLEIVNGGWVQNDEACSNYQDIILQMAVGQQFIYQEFGYIPKIAFNNDGFGHSSAQSAINYLLGMEGQIIERVDTYDIMERVKTHSLEFIWEGGPKSINFLDESQGTKLMTHVRYRRHGPFKFHSKHFANQDQNQEGFCLQVFSQLKDFERLIFNQGAGSLSDNMVFHYGGDDFQLFNETHYEKQQIILEFFNEFKCRNLNVKWSTAGNYFQKLKDNIHHEPKIKKGDFFPYQEDGLYWTAFYTTYPEFKLIVRQASLFLYSIHFYFSQFLISTIDRDDLYADSYMVNMIQDIQELREEVSLAQHHDGITGTSKYWVHDDIISRIKEKIRDCNKNMQTITQLIYIKSFMSNEKVLGGQSKFRPFRQLDNINVIECSLLSESKNKCISQLLLSRNIKKQIESDTPADILLLVLNPQHDQNRFIELNLPQEYNRWQVYNNENKLIKLQEIRCFEDNRCSIVFLTFLKGYTENKLILKYNQRTQELNFNNWEKVDQLDFSDSIKEMERKFEEGEVIDQKIQQFQHVFYKQKNMDFRVKVEQEGIDYQFTFNLTGGGRSSSFMLSYLFYPNIKQQSWNQWTKRTFLGQAGKYVMMNNPNQKGLICQFEQFQKLSFDSELSLDIAIECGKVYQIILRVYPWDIEHGIDIETSMNSEGIPLQQGDLTLQIYYPQMNDTRQKNKIYTDSNGWFMNQRKNYYREDFKPVYNESDEINGNVFPMTSYAFIEDGQNHTLGILTDRAQGVFTHQAKSIDILLEHFGGDDGQGAGEQCNRRIDNFYRHRIFFNPLKCIRCIWNSWQMHQYHQNIRVSDLFEFGTQSELQEEYEYRINNQLRFEIWPLSQKRFLLYFENMQELRLDQYDQDYHNQTFTIYHLIQKYEIVELIRNTPYARHLNSDTYKVDLLTPAYLNGVPITDKIINDDLRPLEIKAYVLQFQ